MKKIFSLLSFFVALHLSAQVSILPGKNGGTGVANTSKTITLGGSVITTGTSTPTIAFPSTNRTFTFPDTSDRIALIHYTLPIYGAANGFIPYWKSSTSSFADSPLSYSVEAGVKTFRATDGTIFRNSTLGTSNKGAFIMDQYGGFKMAADYQQASFANEINVSGSNDGKIYISSDNDLKISVNNTTFTNLTASRAAYFDASKNLQSSAVTSTELGYVGGVTSAIQTQLNGKLSSSYSIAATSATSPLSLSSNTVSISQSDASTNGYLSSTDWNTFNNKASSSATFTINGTGMALGTSSTVTAAAGTLTGATLNSGVTASSLTSFGVSPTFTTPTLGVASATSLAITGTAGNGFISLATQTATPSAPSSGTVLFSNSNSKLSWRGSANNYVKTFDGAILTADRVYSLPNRNAMLDSLTTSTSTALNGYIKGNGSVLSATATIGATDGGTGQTSVTTGDLLYGSATNTWSKLGGASSGSYLRSAGTTTAPLWSTLKLPNSATLNYIPFASATNTWGESSSFQWDDANKFLYVRNTVASGLGGLIAIGNDNATTTLQLFCYGTSQAGNWTNTSIPLAGKAYMQAGSSAVGSYVNAATTMYNLIGTTATNYGSKYDATGFRIDQIQNLHTSNASVFAVGTGFTVNSSGAITAQAGIKGTATNDNASAGQIGEYVESLVAVGSAVTFTTNTSMNITSISLTAGDWDVLGGVNYTETIATVSARTASIGTTSATLATDGSEGECGVQSTLITEKNSIDLPRKRISVSGTTTVYLVGRCVFSAGTASGYGFINARRVR